MKKLRVLRESVWENRMSPTSRKERYKVITLLSILIALFAIEVNWKRRGIRCSLPCCDEQKCMRKKKKKRNETNQHTSN